MIAPRSASLMVVQAAISPVVRPHPMQSEEIGSTTQSLTQGVEVRGGMGYDLGCGRADEKSAPGGDLRPLLGGPRDVAGLAPDLLLRQRAHGGRADGAGDCAAERAPDPDRERAERDRGDERDAAGGGESPGGKPARGRAR